MSPCHCFPISNACRCHCHLTTNLTLLVLHSLLPAAWLMSPCSLYSPPVSLWRSIWWTRLKICNLGQPNNIFFLFLLSRNLGWPMRTLLGTFLANPVDAFFSFEVESLLWFASSAPEQPDSASLTDYLYNFPLSLQAKQRWVVFWRPRGRTSFRFRRVPTRSSPNQLPHSPTSWWRKLLANPAGLHNG